MSILIPTTLLSHTVPFTGSIYIVLVSMQIVNLDIDCINLNTLLHIGIPLNFKFLPSIQFVCCSSFTVVSWEITIFADSVGIICSFSVRTLICQFLTAPRVVTVLAHSFSVECHTRMWTLGYIFLLFTFFPWYFLNTSSFAAASGCLCLAAAFGVARLSCALLWNVTRWL